MEKPRMIDVSNVALVCPSCNKTTRVNHKAVEDKDGKAWGCEIILTEEFISALYGTDYTVKPCKIKGNFYKCADDSVTPHYGAYFPVTTAALGFHNPDCFGTIIIGKV